MYVEYEKIAFRNFLSSGQAIVEFDFSKGFNQLSGVSGSGKSKVLDILSFALYGKPLKKVKMANLINRKNKSNLWVCLTARFGDRRFRITRGMKPDLFDIEEQLNGKWVAIPESSSKAGHQAFLTKMHGISYDVFRQVVVLAVSKTSQNFLDMEAKDRRSIISNIFNMHIVEELKELAVATAKGLEISNGTKNSNLQILGETLRKLEISSDSIKNRDEEAWNARLAEIKQVGITCTNNVKILTENLAQETQQFESKKLVHQRTLDGLKYDDAFRHVSTKSFVDMKLRQVDKKISENAKEVGGTCSNCGQVVTAEHMAKELKKLEFERQGCLDELEGIKASEGIVERCQVLIADFSGVERKYLTQKATLEADIRNTKAYIESLKAEVGSLKAKLADKSENNVFTQQIEDTKAEIRNIQNSVANDERRISALSNLNKHVLTDKHFKASYLNKYMEPLNDLINEYSRDFLLPFVFTFDSVFDVTIESTLNGGSEFEYGQLSEGQMKRLDIAISFSFIEIMKTVSNWDCNLLVLDEVLDRGLDVNSLNAVIAGLKMIQCTGRGKSVWIISHKNIEPKHFDRVVTASLVNGFTHYQFC